MQYKDKSFNQQKIAADRIIKLLSEAESAFKEHPELSKRYIILARKLSTRYKVRLTFDQKKLFCKNCNSFLKNGINMRVRLEHGIIAQTCLRCSAIKRISYTTKNSKPKKQIK